MNRSTSQELSSKLGKLLSTPPISIELLPGNGSEWLASASPEHAPFLFMDRNLGVPQKLAYKAYLESVARFREARSSLRSSLATGDSPRSQIEDDVVQALLESSSILLLVNPAHVTALNARKRLVLLDLLSPDAELQFTDALLTLREGAKQSVLWNHRRWILRRVYPPAASLHGSEDPSSQDGEDTLFGAALDAAAFRREFAVLERACEVYPRNYHAWAHRYLCVSHILSLIRSGQGDIDHAALLGVLSEERGRVRFWIERHVSDYSAMQYCCCVEALLSDSRNCSDAGEDLKKMAAAGLEEVPRHALELLRAYTAHEALWLYLRGALALGLSGNSETRQLSAQFVRTVLESGEASDTGERRHAVWYVAWELREDGQLVVDAECIRRIQSIAEDQSQVDYSTLQARINDGNPDTSIS